MKIDASLGEMRTVLTVFLFGTVAIFAQMPSEEEITKYVLQCQNSTNATNEDLSILETLDVPKNERQACLAGCLYKKLGLVDDNNTVKIDMIGKIFTPDSNGKEALEEHKRFVDILTKCAKDLKPSKDLCDASKKYMTCLKTSMTEMEATTAKKGK